MRAMGGGEGTNEQVWMALGKAGHGRGGEGGESRCASGGMDV